MNQTLKRFSLCVYCGSRPGHDPAHAHAAQAVGRWLGLQGGHLVYGGGNQGLMGIVAHAVLSNGGSVLGIIPQALVHREVAKTDCTELVVVDTMHERKQLMMAHADAFLALPGGIGTFEELFEVWTWRHLGYHAKPVGLLNVNGFYDALHTFLQHSEQSGFVSAHQMASLCLGTNPDALLHQLRDIALGLRTADQPPGPH